MTNDDKNIRWGLVIMAAVVALAAAVWISYHQGQSNPPQTTTKPTPEASVTSQGHSDQPRTAKAARKIIEKATGRTMAGDQAGVYALFPPEDKKIISKKRYLNYQQKCYNSTTVPHGSPFQVKDVHKEGKNRAVGIVKILGFSTTVRAVYEDGQWWAPMAGQNRVSSRYYAHHHRCKSY